MTAESISPYYYEGSGSLEYRLVYEGETKKPRCSDQQPGPGLPYYILHQILIQTGIFSSRYYTGIGSFTVDLF